MIKESSYFLFPLEKDIKVGKPGDKHTCQPTDRIVSIIESSKTIYVDVKANSRIEIKISFKPDSKGVKVHTRVEPVSKTYEAGANHKTKASNEVSLTAKPKVKSTLEKKQASRSGTEKVKEVKIKVVEQESVPVPKKEEKCKLVDPAKTETKESEKASALTSSSHLPGEIPSQQAEFAKFTDPIKQHGRLDIDCYCWMEDACDFFTETPNVKEVYGQYVKEVNISYSSSCHAELRQLLLECRYDVSRDDESEEEEEEKGVEEYLFDRMLFHDDYDVELEYIFSNCPNIENVKFEGVDYTSKIKEYFSKVEFSKMSGK